MSQTGIAHSAQESFIETGDLPLNSSGVANLPKRDPDVHKASNSGFSSSRLAVIAVLICVMDQLCLALLASK